MITIKDIAKEIHVSTSTVSKALSGADDISEETKRLVVECAQKYGYVPRKYNSQERGQVAVFVEGMNYEDDNQFGYELVFGFQMAANQMGYNVNIVNISKDNKQSYYDFMTKSNYEGAFLLGMNLKDKRLKELETTPFPSVLFDNYIENPKVAYVGTDNKVGFDLAVKHLIKLGHKKIAFLNGEASSMVSYERKQAYKIALKRNGLNFITELYAEGDYFQDFSDTFVPIFLNNGATAILCASDIIAGFVIEHLKRNNIKVPHEVSVIGYDNIPMAKYLNLTTLAQNRIELGKIAFNTLKLLMENVSINTLLLRPQLVVRNTTAAANENKIIERGV